MHAVNKDHNGPRTISISLTQNMNISALSARAHMIVRYLSQIADLFDHNEADAVYDRKDKFKEWVVFWVVIWANKVK